MAVANAEVVMTYEVSGVTYTVQPRCQAVVRPGFWICAAHARAFRGPDGLAEHLKIFDGDHVMVFQCDDHGPEVP